MEVQKPVDSFYIRMLLYQNNDKEGIQEKECCCIRIMTSKEYKKENVAVLE